MSDATIHPEKILKELSELWVTLAKPDPSGESARSAAGVLRACAMTLITVVDESEDPANVGETLACLMREHPSRAIVIRLRESSARELSAQVLAQCWMPFGGRQQICCEQIEIISSDASLPDIPAVALPLAVPDLPVILWCRSARLFAMESFPLLASLAEKVVVDSAALCGKSGDPATALRELAKLTTSGRIISDLEWTRLTRWRELISQIFETRENLDSLKSVDRVVIGHTPAKPTAAARYLAAWTALALEKIGVAPEVRFQQASASIELAGGDTCLMMKKVGAAVEYRVRSQTGRALFAKESDYTLLREELSIPGCDTLFEACLGRAVADLP